MKNKTHPGKQFDLSLFYSAEKHLPALICEKQEFFLIWIWEMQRRLRGRQKKWGKLKKKSLKKEKKQKIKNIWWFKWFKQ